MLRSMNDLEGYTIVRPTDSLVTLETSYFDDKAWVIRYLIVDTGAGCQIERC